MAHFRATIQGARGEASRLGSKAGGLFATVNGWDEGISVEAKHANGLDVFELWANGGSNGRHHKMFLGTVCEGVFRAALTEVSK